MTTTMNSQQLNELNSRREKDGTFGSKLHPEAPVTVGAPAPSFDLDAMEAARDEQMERWSTLMDEAPGSDEFAALDTLHQKASLECASAAVLDKYPGAATLVLKENEDGENQYDIESILDADGNTLAGFDDRSGDYEIAYGKDSYANETVWALNPQDDTWAEGKAEITEKMGTKFAAVDLKAVLAQR